MKRHSFRKWMESVDIFGFEKEIPKEVTSEDRLELPIRPFNTELMMDFLEKKSIGRRKPNGNSTSEMYWGKDLGSVKLEIDTGLTFFVKKLGKDLKGNERWVTKKMFQLNRNGFGGHEDAVAQEIYEHLKEAFEAPNPSPKPNFTEMDSLVRYIFDKLKRTAKPIFLPEGIKKLNDNSYIICFNVRNYGLEARNQRRIEQNQTMISFDPEYGTIRITNYNIESPTGGIHEWKIMPSDLDVYFFPSQDREEIADAISVHYKYY